MKSGITIKLTPEQADNAAKILGVGKYSPEYRQVERLMKKAKKNKSKKWLKK